MKKAIILVVLLCIAVAIGIGHFMQEPSLISPASTEEGLEGSGESLIGNKRSSETPGALDGDGIAPEVTVQAPRPGTSSGGSVNVAATTPVGTGTATRTQAKDATAPSTPPAMGTVPSVSNPATGVASGFATTAIPSGPTTTDASSMAGELQAQPTFGESNIPVPLGARVPVAVLDDKADYTPQQRAALEAIINDFQAELQQGSVSGSTDPATGGESTSAGGVSSDEVWREAQKRADDRYRILFGFAAYESLHRKAAMEALNEAKALQNAAPK